MSDGKLVNTFPHERFHILSDLFSVIFSFYLFDIRGGKNILPEFDLSWQWRDNRIVAQSDRSVPLSLAGEHLYYFSLAGQHSNHLHFIFISKSHRSGAFGIWENDFNESIHRAGKTQMKMGFLQTLVVYKAEGSFCYFIAPIVSKMPNPKCLDA